MRTYSRRGFLAVLAWPVFGIAGAAVFGCGSDAPEEVAKPSATSTSTAPPAPSPSATQQRTPPSTKAPLNADLHRIVDKKRALPDGYAPPNVEAIPASWHAGNVSGQRLRADVIVALRPMFEAAKADQVTLYVESAYRSYDEQVRTFNYWVSVVGEAQARRESAEPGHSEHQLGTTVDFADPSNGWRLLESFAGSPSGRWLAANAYKFGFAMSYPPNGEAITGYIYEPWHFRYIGVAAAQEWHASGKTLIEYLEALAAAG